MSETRDMEEYEREIELIDYIEVLLKRKKLIIIGTLVCVLVTGLYSVMQPQSYQAESLVVVSPAIVAAGTAQQERGEGGVAPQVSEIIVPSMAAQTYEGAGQERRVDVCSGRYLDADAGSRFAGEAGPYLSMPTWKGSGHSCGNWLDLIEKDEKAL